MIDCGDRSVAESGRGEHTTGEGPLAATIRRGPAHLPVHRAPPVDTPRALQFKERMEPVAAELQLKARDVTALRRELEVRGVV